MKRHHIVISGPGRSGTSFFVHYLTALGINTGFKLSDIQASLNPLSRAGLEKDIRSDRSPYVVKSPHFCEYAEEVIGNPGITLDHVFVLIRDLYAAAESRRRVTSLGERNGGLWGVSSMQPGIQEAYLAVKTYSLIECLARNRVPFSILSFPLMTEDHDYLFECISGVWPEIPRRTSESTWSKVVNPARQKSN